MNLYQKLAKAERVNDIIRANYEELKETLKEFEQLSEFPIEEVKPVIQIDVARLQRHFMEEYKGNPVLDDAIQGRLTVEESLVELGQVNRGIRKILPWRLNKAHNIRLKQLGDLVSEPSHLYMSGVFMPDNFVTTVIEGTALTFGICYLFARYLLPEMYTNLDSIVLAQDTKIFTTTMPALVSAFVAPLIGIGVNSRRFKRLPLDEARYLDGKVEEFYR